MSATTSPGDDMRNELYSLLKADKRADTYVIPSRVMDIIAEYFATSNAQAELRGRIDELRLLLSINHEDITGDEIRDRIAQLTAEASEGDVA